MALSLLVGKGAGLQVYNVMQPALLIHINCHFASVPFATVISPSEQNGFQVLKKGVRDVLYLKDTIFPREIYKDVSADIHKILCNRAHLKS